MHQHIYIHAYIHKYIHACNIHTYMHACIHTYVYTYRPWSGVICFAGDAERGEIVRCGLVYYKTFEDYEKAFDLSEEELLKGLWPAVGVCVCVCISLSLSSSLSLPLSLSLSHTHTHMVISFVLQSVTGCVCMRVYVHAMLETEEFFAAHPEWKLADRFANNNGLTVLVRDPAA
jgi:hypothetical protein